LKKALLLDTGFSSWPILRRLESAGLQVHVAGANPTDALARGNPRYHRLDYRLSESVARLRDRLNADYLIPGCNDQSYISCAACAIPGVDKGIDSVANTAAINNKKKFRQVAIDHGLPVPEVYDWPRQEPGRAVMVKPANSFSGKGVTLIKQPNAQAIAAAIKVASNHSQTQEWVVEEFVEGQLYSHSAFFFNGRIEKDFLVIESSSVNPYVVDTSYVVESIPGGYELPLRKLIADFANRLNLVEGLIHTQFIVNDNRICIIEMTRRCPGDLYSRLIELSTGHDYVTYYLSKFLGADPDTSAKERKFVLRHTMTQGSNMRFYCVSFNLPLMIEEWVSLALTGDDLTPSPGGRVGLLFIRADSQEQLHATYEELKSKTVYQLA
jgi:biotin carboxylase